MSNSPKAAFSATKILLPIDFSPSSEAALEAATGLAEQFHAGIHLVHIIPEIPDWNGSGFFPATAVLQERKQTIEQKLDAYRQQLMQKGVLSSFSIDLGNDIVGSLMQVIERENTDMVVISTHGMSGWHPLIFGSIAEHIIKQANCTMLLLQADRRGLVAEEPAMAVGENSVVPQGAETGHLESTIPERTLSQRRLDRVAGNLAERSGRTEQQYDQGSLALHKVDSGRVVEN